MIADEFEAAVAPLFEGAPAFVRRLADEAPFASWDGFFERARVIARAMPEPDQVELLNAHPRLGATSRSMSRFSRREQAAGARGEDEPARTIAELARLNDTYEARFGFRYCVFVAGRPLEALVPDLGAALARDRAAELHRGLDAVIDIARARQVAPAGVVRGG